MIVLCALHNIIITDNVYCTRAVEYLRRSNHRNYLPRGLLTRAALYRLQNQFALAHYDLQEALDITRSSAMDFYQADAYLEQAALHLAATRLALHQDHVYQAAASLEEAKQLMHRMGYYRRHRQVTELEAMLQGAQRFVRRGLTRRETRALLCLGLEWCRIDSHPAI